MKTHSLTFACLLTAAAMCIPLPNYAASAKTEAENERICVPVLRLWAGALEDVRALKAKPVPDSFKNGRQGCGGFLLSENLVNWHLRFGSSETAEAALEFIKAREKHKWQLTDAKKRDIAIHFDKFRTTASGIKIYSLNTPDKRAFFFEQSSDLDYILNQLENMDAPLRLSSLYLDVAETFGTRSARDRVTKDVSTYATSKQEVLRILAVDESTALEREAVDYIFMKLGQDFVFAKAKTRLALIRAAETRDEVDLENAKEALEDMRGPHYETIFRYAYRGGSEFCDLPQDAGESLQDLCDGGEIVERITDYNYYLSLVELLDNNIYPASHFIETSRLQQAEPGFRSGYFSDDRRVSNLYIAMAEREYRARRSVIERRLQDFTTEKGRVEHEVDQLRGTLEAFIRAARQVDPTQNPLAFEHAASRAIEIDNEIRRLRQKHGIEQRDTFLDVSMSWIKLMHSHLREFIWENAA